ATGPLGVTEEYSKHDRLAQRFKVDQDRLTILKEVNEMYHSDDRAKAIIDNTSEDATYGGFEVTVAEAEGGRTEEAQQILNDTRKLFGGLVGWAKKGLIEGDLFLQVVVADSDVVELIRMPASTMRRNSNDKDKFDDPLKAYAQVDPLSGAAYALEINLAQVDSWFAEWQVTHARWNHLGGRYGNSLFRSSRGSYKKAREGETDMAIRRKTRAGIKYVHELEDASEAELEAYKERNKDTLKNPFAAIADFFTNKKTKITAIQGDAKLDQIKDVEHHINTMFVSSPIPKSLVGYGESINRDVLDKQEAQYLRRLESVADWVNEQIIKPVLDLQLLLKGILPESVSYNIVWPDRSMDTFVDVIDGAVKIKSLGLPDRYVLQVLRKVITDLNIKAVLEEMESEKQTNTDKETDAIAKNLELMKAQMRGSDPKERKKAKEAIERIIRGVGDVAGDSEEEFIDRLKALRGVS
ncbi:MAG: portal protein, partial [Actinobacteria bacterium]|nr:portal protein [Actinomycetota bacterium]